MTVDISVVSLKKMMRKLAKHYSLNQGWISVFNLQAKFRDLPEFHDI